MLSWRSESWRESVRERLISRRHLARSNTSTLILVFCTLYGSRRRPDAALVIDSAGILDMRLEKEKKLFRELYAHNAIGRCCTYGIVWLIWRVLEPVVYSSIKLNKFNSIASYSL